MAYELEGTLKEVFETKTFGKGFTKREFVVTVTRGPDDRYPQHVKLSVIKDKVSLLDRFKSGQRVKVTFDIRGSENAGRYFTDLQAWKIDAAEGGGEESRPARGVPEEPADAGEPVEEDMPF
jgi:single-strand DNA-binding protein